MLMTNIFETIVIVRITDAHYLKIQVAGTRVFSLFLQRSGRYGWKKTTKAKILFLFLTFDIAEEKEGANKYVIRYTAYYNKIETIVKIHDEANKALKFKFYYFSPFLIPVDGGVVHLVDEDDHVLHSGSLDQHGVFAGLTSAFEAGLEFAFSGRNHLKPERNLLKLCCLYTTPYPDICVSNASENDFLK
jgi:hypothetical protein